MNNADTELLTDAAYLAALAWQFECGVEVAVCELPVDRYAVILPVQQAPVTRLATFSPIEEAQSTAACAGDLGALRDALAAYPHCALRQGARNLVFADGDPHADVMLIGEAPGREEDIEGRPFVGAAGQLLDKMFAAIARDRASKKPAQGLYITNVLPWRPPGNRAPEPDEIAMMRPFLLRHITLVAPKVIIALGNTPLVALTGQGGILRARGNWSDVQGIPLLPMVHPAYLLRNPIAKREAWADLLALKARLNARGHDE